MNQKYPFLYICLMKKVEEIVSNFKRKLKLVAKEKEVVSWAYMTILHILDYNRSDCILNSNKIIEKKDREKIFLIIDRLLRNEPIQYVLGSCQFLDLELKVNKHVLIPRAETEELVEWTLQEKFSSALDIGTGSGCIAIALAKYSKAKIEAIDISSKALGVAKNNAIFNNTKVKFIEGDILQLEMEKTFDVIVSNPPYVLDKEKIFMNHNVIDYEPHLALFVPDENPLIFYKRIIDISTKLLNNNGRLFLEINEKFGIKTNNLLQEFGFVDIELKKDINGKDRMLKAVWK